MTSESVSIRSLFIRGVWRFGRVTDILGSNGGNAQPASRVASTDTPQLDLWYSSLKPPRLLPAFCGISWWCTLL